MKNEIEIFTIPKLKSFFSNFEQFFEINLLLNKDLERLYNNKKLSLIFLDEESNVSQSIIKKIFNNENLIFVCKDQPVFEKFSLSKRNTLISPMSLNKLLDTINNIINNRVYIYGNTQINSHIIQNINSKKKIYITEAENHILLELFKNKSVTKKLLERKALKIKEDLNTSSIDSHLNRIRKKLKKIESNFTISSKDKSIVLDVLI